MRAASIIPTRRPPARPHHDRRRDGARKNQGHTGFPAAAGRLVEHLILSHHGTHEFGSPSLPQTPEAVALHFIDDIDSKMAGMRMTLDVGVSHCE